MRIKKNKTPKFLERIFSFFPLLWMLEISFLFISFIKNKDFKLLIPFIFVLFFQAPILWRVISLIFGPCPSVSYFGKFEKNGNLWLISFYLQQPYNNFPFIENILKLIPPFYSLWLRGWGSKLGLKNIWTSGCIIVDRPFLILGDKNLFGNLSYLSTHVIKKKNKKYVVYQKEIKIESDVVVGYRVTVTSGCLIKSGTVVPAGTNLYPNTVFEAS